MINIRKLQGFITSVLAFTLICSGFNAAFAQSANFAEIISDGRLLVNGTRNLGSSMIVSDSEISTGENGNGVIYFGSNGRLELFRNTLVTIKFSEGGFNVVLSQGKVRVISSPGANALVTTRNGVVLADTAQANSFTVALGCSGDDECEETFVYVYQGAVGMEADMPQLSRQVTAGNHASSGPLSESCVERCKILALPTKKGVGLMSSILGGFSALASALLFLENDGLTTIDGNIPNTSPSS